MKKHIPRKSARETLAQANATNARAQKRAQHIIEHAQQEAQRIQARARDRAKRIGEGARVATTHAVRLFRINLANTLTLFNGVFGFLAIIASIQREFFLAGIFILCGVLCDWLDGKAARAFGEETELGRELDSLSDLITFGVAPAVLVAIISPSFFSFGAGALFVLSAALRLGRFNIQQTKGTFVGVPTTVNGIFLPLLIFFGAPQAVYPVYLLVFALLMNAPFRIKKIF